MEGGGDYVHSASLRPSIDSEDRGCVPYFVGSLAIVVERGIRDRGHRGRGNDIEEPAIILGQIHHCNLIRVLVVFYTRRILGERKIKTIYPRIDR